MPELIHSFGHTFFRIEFQRIVLYYTFLIYFRRKEDIAINDDAINHIRSSYVCVFHESLPKFLNYRLQAVDCRQFVLTGIFQKSPGIFRGNCRITGNGELWMQLVIRY